MYVSGWARSIKVVRGTYDANGDEGVCLPMVVGGVLLLQVYYPCHVGRLCDVRRRVVLAGVDGHDIRGLVLYFLRFVEARFVRFLFRRQGGICVHAIFSRGVRDFVFREGGGVVPANRFLILHHVLFSCRFVAFKWCPRVR